MTGGAMHRGIVRAFDAATYTAVVQVEDSRSAYAPRVPVSRGIPAAELQPGRVCVVAVFNPDDADDAMVVGVR
jgi:hypothetical protein